jgi:prepilin-type N-terminal cleavage/methylation domain-containing protein
LDFQHIFSILPEANPKRLQEISNSKAHFKAGAMKAKRGFTLIELLVVIAILALLISIILPALRKVKDQAKLTICASNQRQLVFGLTSYAVDNNDKLPPSPSKDDLIEGKYHRPIELNWNLNAMGPVTDPEQLSYYHYAGRYLGSYLPDVDVFNCTMAPIDPESPWPPVTSGLDAVGTYGDLYRNGKYAPLHSTYVLLWSYQGYNHDVSIAVDTTQVDFEGAEKLSSATKLVVQDSLFYLAGNTNILWDGPLYSWHVSHPFRYAVKADPYYTVADDGTNVPDVWVNAGYLDGHSERFHSYDTVKATNWTATVQLTRKFR